jgi:hypothetical protein
MTLFAAVTRTTPSRFLPGFMGGASAPVPSTETCEAPTITERIDPAGPDGAGGSEDFEQATPITVSPRPASNCRRVRVSRESPRIDRGSPGGSSR